MKILCVLGAPGAGKSTMIAALPGARAVLHVGRLAKAAGHPPNVEPGALRGAWHQLIARPLAEAVAAGGLVVLDGFPRSPEQAQWLRAAFPQATIHAVACPLDEAAALASMAGRGDATPKAIQKWRRWLALDVPAVAELVALGVTVTQIPRRSREVMATDLFRAAWGFDLQDAPWDWTGLAAVAAILDPLNIYWEVAHGGVARPIWTAMGYGPAQIPTDIDIRVHAPDVEAARAALTGCSPAGREWTVYPIEVVRTGDCFTSDLMVARYAGGRVSLLNRGGPECAADLFDGRLAPLPGFEARFEAKRPKKLAGYPGLDGRQTRRKAKILGVCRPEVGPLAAAIRAQASILRREIPMPPVAAQRNARTPAPAAAALLFQDPEWRDWLLRIFRSHREEFRAASPGWEALDALVRWAEVVLDRSAHGGGSTSTHHVNVAYFLDTSGLSREETRNLRVAALCHDIGKRAGQRVSGAHGAAGAQMISAGTVPLPAGCDRAVVADLVARHDVPGRVIKGCLDPLDPGCQPAASLAGISDLHWRLWRADVASVPRWRWTLELEPLLRAPLLRGGG